MSFITYILLIVFNSAFSGSKDFNPDVLGIKATKNFTILFLYTLILKFGKLLILICVVFYVFCNVNVPLLDLLSYVSYKFVLLIVNVLVWMFFKNNYIYYTFLLYSIFISMIFMHHILNYRIKKENDIRIHQKLIIYIVSSLEVVTIFLILLDIDK